MKLWYAVALVGVVIIVLAWSFQGKRSKRAATVPVVVEAKEDSSWSAPSQAIEAREDSSWSVSSQVVADLREELPEHLRARVPKQQAHRPASPRTVTAVRPHRQSRTRDAGQQTTRDEAQAIRKTDPQELEAQEGQRIEQIVSHLDDAFHSEPDGGRGATSIEAGIVDDFETHDWHGSALAEASCRATLCRMVVEHEDLDAAGAFVPRMGTLQPFANTEAFYQQVTREDGTSATVVYIARQGYRLPALPLP